MPRCRFAVMLLFPLILSTVMITRPSNAQFCWRGKPLPKCRYFLLTESGVYIGTEIGVHGDLGFMANVAPRSAAGASVHGMLGGDIDTNWGTAGVGLRYRHWLSQKWAIDVSPRLQFTKRQDLGEWKGPTFGVTCAMGLSELIGLAVVVDSYKDLETRYCIGIYLGSYLGAPGTALLGLLGIWEAVAR